MILTRKDIAELLGVTIAGLSKIEQRNTLEERLDKIGYKLISKTKNGRSYKYKVEQYSQDKESFNNICNGVFNIKDSNKFGDYYMYRTENIDVPVSKEDIADKVNINRNTVGSWDNKMIEQKILSKDGFFYIAIDFDEDGSEFYRLSDEYEYTSYVKSSLYVKARNKLFDKYDNKELNRQELELAIEGAKKYAKSIEGKFIYRINKYKINKNSMLHELIIKLIDKKDKNFRIKSPL